MSQSRRPSVNEIPRDIREQEAEIESIFRNLIQLGDGSCLDQTQHLPNHKPTEEALGRTLIAMLG
jgi:hypothetical protein